MLFLSSVSTVFFLNSVRLYPRPLGNFNHIHGFNQHYKLVTSKSAPQSRSSSEIPILIPLAHLNATWSRLDSSPCQTVSSLPVAILWCYHHPCKAPGDNLRISSFPSSLMHLNPKAWPFYLWKALSSFSFSPSWFTTTLAQLSSIQFISCLLNGYRLLLIRLIALWGQRLGGGLSYCSSVSLHLLPHLLSHYCLLRNFQGSHRVKSKRLNI